MGTRIALRAKLIGSIRQESAASLDFTALSYHGHGYFSGS